MISLLVVVAAVALLYYLLTKLGTGLLAYFGMSGGKLVDERLSNQYCTHKGVISFCPQGNRANGEQPMQTADGKSFRVLGYHYARDKATAYFQDKPMAVDLETFKVLPGSDFISEKYVNSRYAVDKSQVYFLSQTVSLAEVNSFRALWGNYGRDNDALFYCGKIFHESSGVEDKLAGDNERQYLKVDDSIFFRNQPITGADLETFLLLGDGLARDQYRVYFENSVIPGVDAATFKRVSDRYCRDENNVYYYQEGSLEALPNCDPFTFHIIGEGFSKDARQVFYKSHILMNAQAHAFGANRVRQLSHETTLMLVYYDDQHVDFINRNAITSLSSQYFIYQNEIYCGASRLDGADPHSFQTSPLSDMYAMDDFHAYYRSRKIARVDLATFEVINANFARDKNHVYFQDKRLIDIKPDSFVYQTGMDGNIIDEDSARLMMAA